MKHIINNFKMGLIVAIVFTCLQSYGLYKYGAGLTYAHPIGYTFLFGVMFFSGWWFIGTIFISVVHVVYQLIIYIKK
mgnify:CR=1 FL=1